MLKELEGTEYIGDGVYLNEDDGRGHAVLMTSDGRAVTNTIYLDAAVRRELIRRLTGGDDAEDS